MIDRKKCPCCQNKKFKEIYRISYNDRKLSDFLIRYYGKKIIHQLKKLSKYYYILNSCVNCNLIFQKYVPDKKLMFEIYENLIDTEISLNKKKNFCMENFKNYFDEFYAIQNLFEKKPNKVKILEFGSGWGFWSNLGQSLNFNNYVHELSQTRVKYQKKLKIIKDINKCKLKFDLIYSDQVFEHIINPLETLKTLKKLLKKNGYILLRFPNSYFFKLKLLYSYLPKNDQAHPLEHINLYNRKSFKVMANMLNLKIVNFDTKYNFDLKKYPRILKNFFSFNKILLKK
jgi:2-polyprenyl-3-methyl-5-hydroxy-6-metoxy-1,4-benzoquinol methylase